MWFRKNNDQLIDKLSSVPETTPDYGLLHRRPMHRVFYVGSRLPFKKLCPAFSIEKMTLWTKVWDPTSNDSDNAIPLPSRRSLGASIRGTLYAVATKDLITLDFFKENGNVFKRKRIPIITPHTNGDGELYRTEAWFYDGVPKHWAEKMDWDLSFFRGKGTYQIAPIADGVSSPIPPLQILRHFYYKPPVPCSVNLNIWRWETHEHNKSTDQGIAEQHAKDEANERKFNPPKEEPRKFIYINSDDK